MFDLDPYSISSLHKRASKLPECPYKLILEMSADQLDAGKVSKKEVKKVIEYARTCNPTLLTVALKILNLNQGQISTALHLLENMQ